MMIELKTKFFAFGGDGGYQTAGDIVTQTIDGVDLNALWAEYQETIALWNERRLGLAGLLTFPVTNLIENVPQVGDAIFQEASEFGEPEAGKIPVSYIQLGYDFKWYDVASRWTWMFLADADVRQIDALHNAYLNGDARLVFRKIMEAIFDNRNRSADINSQAYNVYPLYNGDGMVPPDYGVNEFEGTHSHYLVSGGTEIDPGDLENATEHIEEHGYSKENGTTLIHLVNKAQAKVIRTFRQGQTTNGVVANYDFIPSTNESPIILPAEGILGSRPPSTWQGLRVLGSYNDALIIEHFAIPALYMLTFASGGLGQMGNLVGLREHANPAYRGLRLIAGNQQGYPLTESFYSRGFGTGIRQRGGGVVTQIKASGSYDIPTQYRKGSGLG
ncbi:major capsid protein [Gordonia phage Suzy]|uniref:Major capsid protein n=1 Tax=Gordonia phage Suzy TaxID=2201430 RepID=A0A2Z4Q7Q1_9CAUD|nr:major head protein [Gordonia phage Suzy]AWY06117.1 major capsid protein [Gordonia phage Suzy]